MKIKKIEGGQAATLRPPVGVGVSFLFSIIYAKLGAACCIVNFCRKRPTITQFCIFFVVVTY